jgi:hypothetical protein
VGSRRPRLARLAADDLLLLHHPHSAATGPRRWPCSAATGPRRRPRPSRQAVAGANYRQAIREGKRSTTAGLPRLRDRIVCIHDSFAYAGKLLETVLTVRARGWPAKGKWWLHIYGSIHRVFVCGLGLGFATCDVTGKPSALIRLGTTNDGTADWSLIDRLRTIGICYCSPVLHRLVPSRSAAEATDASPPRMREEKKERKN